MRIPASTARLLIPLIALSFATAMSPAVADSSNGDGHKSGVIYNSIPSPLPGNLVSLGFESDSINEFGNAVNFKSQNKLSLSKVVVTMSSWGCQTGGWSDGSCVTSEDASFSQPITLNIYSPSTDGGLHPGSILASITKTFDIKYRPSASPLCTGADAGKWYDEDSKSCFSGLAQNISFELNNVNVKGSAIFGIAYNTTSHGYAPIGTSAPCFSTSAGCGYDSLNVAITQDPTDVSVGSSVDPGKVWIALTYAPYYADNGTAGLGKFRLDSPNVVANWGVNAPYTSAPWWVPAIKVFTNNDVTGDSHSAAKSTGSHSDSATGDAGHGIKKD